VKSPFTAETQNPQRKRREKDERSNEKRGIEEKKWKRREENISLSLSSSLCVFSAGSASPR
jgi:hypothetical protein